MSEEQKYYVVVSIDNNDSTYVHFVSAESDRKAEYKINEEYPDRDVEHVVEIPQRMQEARSG